MSSTFIDLGAHRAAAVAALESLGHQVIRMEQYGARPEEPTVACLEDVRRSDALLGIYAHRYGFVPSRAERSITEQEYDEARRHSKLCFSFVVDPRQPWPPTMIDVGQSARKLRAFKRKIEKDTVRATFTTPEDPAYQTAISVGAWLHRQVEGSGTSRGPEGNRFLPRLRLAEDLSALLAASISDGLLVARTTRNEIRLATQSGEDVSLVLVADTFAEYSRPTRLLSLGGVAGWAFLNKRTALLPDSGYKPRYLELLGSSSSSELAVPIRQGDKVVGVLHSEAADCDHYSDGIVRSLGELADAIGACLGRLGWSPGDRPSELPWVRLVNG